MLQVRVLVAVVTTTLLAASVASAQAGPDRDEARLKRDAVRAQFLAEQEPPADLEAMGTTPCVNGLAGSYPCLDVDLLAFMPLSSIGGGGGNDVWGWTDPMTGKEYAIMGRSTGTSFVDISDPASPVYLGNLPPHSSNSSWRDIKVYANHAYIVSEAFGHGMQVFDLTELRNVTSPPTTFSETAHYDNFGNAHNIAINEDTGFAYAIGTTSCAGGPHFVDLADPVNPVFAGCHPENIYTHDTQCVVYHGPDADYTGREICFNSNETRVNVIDVTDHSNSFLISELTYSGTGYVHQGWLTEDHRYYIQGDELDEQNFGHNTRTRIVDMTDLDAPLLIGTFDHETAAIDHNLYTLDGRVYMANYRAGLRIMDLDEISVGRLNEIAYFDIYPSSDSASFSGAWSVYPYFASGVVVVSGIGEGLFILEPRFEPSFELDVAPTQFAVCAPDTVEAAVDLTDANGYVGSVSLSVTGLPAGAVETFSVDPVDVPGSSTMTLDVSGTAPGVYPFTLSTTDGTLTEEATLQLTVADQLPGQPVTMAPVDDAVDVPRIPTLVWSATAQAVDYTVEVASDPGFGNVVYSVTTAGTMHIVTDTLDPMTTYWWRVRASNACGVGTTSIAASFTTLAVPNILLVDDDDNSPNVRSTYENALIALGRDFAVWDTNGTDDEPSAAALAPYDTVLWFSGDSFGGVAGPGGGAEQALTSWLDESGCLLIASQDYYYDRGLSGLMTSHLGVSFATGDFTSSSADGRGSVFSGLGPYSLAFPYTNRTDSLVNDATAERAFQGNIGGVGINKDGGIYRTTFLAFGLEGLPGPTAVETTLSTFLGWCEELQNLDSDGDGTTNGDDCDALDPSVWSIPSDVELSVDTVTPDNLSWQTPAMPGADAVTYDVLRSGGPSSFMSGACLESNGTDTVATDGSDPAPGEVYHYLIRVENGCGGNLGNNGNRSAATCP